MAYRLLYDQEVLYDPLSDDVMISDVTMTASVNAAAYLDFTMQPGHPLSNVIQEKGKIVSLYSDKTLLFKGEITKISEDLYGSKDVTCANALTWLNDVKLRPYSTDTYDIETGKAKLQAPTSVDSLLDWYIKQYNANQPDLSKRFTLRTNQAGALTATNYMATSNTGYSGVGEEIDDKILSIGGYLTLSYKDIDGSLLLDFYADAHDANNQIIDFGKNLIDFTKDISTDDLYTAIIPTGGSINIDGNAAYYYHILWSTQMPYVLENKEAKIESSIRNSYVTQKRDDNGNTYFEYAPYIGVYVDRTQEDSEDPAQYSWTPFVQNMLGQGLGFRTTDGSAIVFLHMAYANDSSGNSAFSYLDYNGRSYKGYYLDTTPRNSVNPSDYSWSQIQNGNIAPNSTVTYDPSVSMNYTISASDIPDGVAAKDADFYKEGDKVYSISAVRKYGYKEKQWSDTDIYDAEKLVKQAVVELRKIMNPKPTIEVKAIDLSLFMGDGYDHLDIGQAARVRSKPNNLDEYLIVSEISLDLEEPSNTRYTLGQGFDTLTGQTSGFVSNLNSSINKSLDATSKIDQTAKDAADIAGKSIVSTQEQFYQSDSPIELKGGQWLTTNTWVEGKYTWNRKFITYGNGNTEYQPDETGICISGNDGKDGAGEPVTIVSQSVTYQESLDGVNTPTGTWLDKPPTVQQGHYLWSKTAVLYSDGTTVTSYAVGYVGTNGDNGIDGTGIQSSTVTYALSDQGSNPPTDGWSGELLTATDEQPYLWTRMIIVYTNNTSSTSYSVSKKGSDGQNGSDGVGVKSSSVRYAYSTTYVDPDSFGEAFWQAVIPDMALVPGTYLYTRTVTLYTDGTRTTGYSVSLIGQDGKPGVGIKSSTVTYQVGTSATEPPTGEWLDSIPAAPAGSYLWTKTVTEYTDGKTTTAYSVAYQGSDGADGGETVYCTSTTTSSTAAKIAYPVSGSIQGLTSGMVVSVKFTYGNTATNPTLNVNNTGAKPILTNGVRYAYWSNNQAVLFMYDGTNWLVISAPVYANTVTVGNPISKNVYIDSDSVDIRNGTTVGSTFTENGASIGKNSIGAVVGFAGDSVTISSTTDTNANDKAFTNGLIEAHPVSTPGVTQYGRGSRLTMQSSYQYSSSSNINKSEIEIGAESEGGAYFGYWSGNRIVERTEDLMLYAKSIFLPPHSGNSNVSSKLQFESPYIRVPNVEVSEVNSKSYQDSYLYMGGTKFCSLSDVLNQTSPALCLYTKTTDSGQSIGNTQTVVNFKTIVLDSPDKNSTPWPGQRMYMGVEGDNNTAVVTNSNGGPGGSVEISASVSLQQLSPSASANTALVGIIGANTMYSSLTSWTEIKTVIFGLNPNGWGMGALPPIIVSGYKYYRVVARFGSAVANASGLCHAGNLTLRHFGGADWFESGV